MTKVRILILLSTLGIVALFGTIAILYARGFRLEQGEDSITISPKGLLVVNSEPTGAQIIINSELKSATNNTVTLSPGEHTVTVRKDGFQEWSKQVIINQEEVTVVNAFLLPTAPSLTAFTFSGAVNPTVSDDLSKILYIVPESPSADKKAGIWVIDTANLPLGFSRDPRQITDRTFIDPAFEWSPDSREVLITEKTNTYRVSTTAMTAGSSLTPLTAIVRDTIRNEWVTERQERQAAQMATLHDEISMILQKNAKDINFSPDANRILYTASGSAIIPEGVANSLPGSSTQKQVRDIKDGYRYVYDIKEDRNFEVGQPKDLMYWIPNSLNLIVPEKDRISIVDYDSTNRKTVFTGNYVYPHAYPSTSTGRILFLTNFGAQTEAGNLYWLSLK